MTGAWLPKTFTTLSGYSRRQFLADLQAGVVVGIVAIPLAIAFAIASGVPPETGLVTAAVAGLLISFLGGSRVQIGGPTGAFVVIVSGIVARHGIDGLTICTILAGIFLVILGLARFGAAIKFIPYPVVTGFTSGIAVIIFSSQIRDLLGLRMTSVPAPFFEKMSAYAASLPTASPAAVAVAAGSLAILLGWPRVSRTVPAPIVAILAGSVLVALLGLPVETIGTRFGEIRASIPAPRLPSVTLERIRELFSPAVTVALLAGIESLLSAVVADGMIGSRHKSNVELVAQGVANVASGLFGGMPATGAIARTATNVKAGGRTPVAGMTHAAVVAAAFLFLGKWARYIPLATLAAILVVVAYHMSEWRAFTQLFRTPKSDVAVLLTTFLLTVLIDLTVAVQVGVVLAAFLFIKRMADVTNVGMVTEEWNDVPDGTMRGDAEGVARRSIPAGVEVYEVNGPFFFGAADQIKDVLHFVAKKPKVFILRMRNVPAIDASGIRVLDDLFRSFSHQHIRFLISGIRAQPLEALERAGKLDEYGRQTFVATIDEALEVATRHVAASAGPAERAP
ncbi:MAG: sulfate permease [Thermoanaerobaculia bacterium]